MNALRRELGKIHIRALALGDDLEVDTTVGKYSAIVTVIGRRRMCVSLYARHTEDVHVSAVITSPGRPHARFEALDEAFARFEELERG